MSEPEFQNQLKKHRLEKGWTQAGLARQVGLTRQGLAKIEAGSFLPNTKVALLLARVLGVGVEELFQLSPELPTAICEPIPSPGPRRLRLARVGGRWVGYPAEASRPLWGAFEGADVALAPGQDSEFFTDPSLLERTAWVLGCDPALQILSQEIGQIRPDCRVHTLAISSTQALEALAQGETHLAGTHLVTPAGEPDLGPAEAALAKSGGGEIWTFASWEQGLVLAPGNPRSIHRVEDLFQDGLRVLRRPLGSGSRNLLDTRLRQSGLDPRSLVSDLPEAKSHAQVCYGVLQGLADTGMAVASLARTLGLEFLPLGEVRFDLVVRADALDFAPVQALRELLFEPRLIRQMKSLPSYQVRDLGRVVRALGQS